MNSAFAASEKAIVKSDVNAEKWRENANEWRAAMMDREQKFAPRSEMDTEIKSIRMELSGLKESRDRGTGAHAQQGDNRAWLAAAGAVILLVLSLVTFFLRGTGTAPQVIMVPAPSGTLLPSTPPATVPR